MVFITIVTGAYRYITNKNHSYWTYRLVSIGFYRFLEFFLLIHVDSMFLVAMMMMMMMMMMMIIIVIIILIIIIIIIDIIININIILVITIFIIIIILQVFFHDFMLCCFMIVYDQ